MVSGAPGQFGRVLAELAATAMGLLEVVADQLVALDRFPCSLLEPVGEPLVQLRADSLRQRVVGCVADQQMAEPKAVLAR